MRFFRKTKKQKPPAGAAPDRLLTVRVEAPGRAGRQYVLPAWLLDEPRLAPLTAEAEAEYGTPRGDVVRVPCRPCHFVDAMVRDAVDAAMQQGRAVHGAAVDQADEEETGRRDLGWYLARPH